MHFPFAMITAMLELVVLSVLKQQQGLCTQIQAYLNHALHD